jgi:hypothetical protein
MSLRDKTNKDWIGYCDVGFRCAQNKLRLDASSF